VGTAPSGLQELIRRRVETAAQDLVDHGQRVAVDGDAEDVHRFRVAVRRLRSDLRSYSPCFEQDLVASLRGELSCLSDRIGELRNRDVLRERLVGGLERLGPADAPAETSLVALVDRERQEAQAALRLHLLSVEYRQLTERLGALGGPPPADAPATDSEIVELTLAPLSRLEKAVAKLGPHPDDAVLHRVRILAKRARYATEAIEPAVGRPARRLARALTAVQDVLGEHQDAVMTETWLRAAAAAEPSLGLVAGLLVAEQRRDAERTRAAFPQVWKRVRARARKERAELARRFDR
jgi:CHAD domain-containing protein